MIHSRDKLHLQSSMVATVHCTQCTVGSGVTLEDKHHMGVFPYTSWNPWHLPVPWTFFSFISTMRTELVSSPTTYPLLSLGMTSALTWMTHHPSLIPHSWPIHLLVSSNLHVTHFSHPGEWPCPGGLYPCPETLTLSNLKCWRYHILRPRVLSSCTFPHLHIFFPILLGFLGPGCQYYLPS